MSIINDKSRLCHATFNNRMAKNVGAEQMYNSLSHTHMLPFAALRAIWAYFMSQNIQVDAN